MSDLALIKVSEDSRVDARELHAFLDVGTRFHDWIKSRIETFGFENINDFHIVKSKSSNYIGKIIEKIDYSITLDMAKELCMVERNEKGRRARKYFIECEKALREPLSPMLMIAKMATDMDRNNKRLTLVENKLDFSTGESILTSAQMSKLTRQISSRAEMLGDVKLNGAIKGALKRRFLVGSTQGRTYKEIPQKHFEDAMIFAANWRPL